VEKKSIKKLQENSSFKKISLIDENVASAFTGLNADARVIVNHARIEAQSYRLTYDENPSVDYISKHISSLMQKFTQTGGARPFGLSILIGGLNIRKQPQLNQVDPSGMITCFKANSIGYINQQKL